MRQFCGRWLPYQAVQVINLSILQLLTEAVSNSNAPRHWADEQDRWCTLKQIVHFLTIANEAGLRHHMQQDQLNKILREELCLCISGRKPTTKTNTAEDDHTAYCSPPALYQLKHNSKATNTSLWSPEEQPEYNNAFHKTELSFCADEIIYTNGRKKDHM